MDRSAIGHEQKQLDVRDITQLDSAFALADSIVTKNYLSTVDKCKIRETGEEQDSAAIYEHASLFRVKKIVYDRNENNLQKLVNTYASTVGFTSSLVMIINSNGTEVELYLGTTGANSIDSARASAEALRSNFVGNFPGSLSGFEEIGLENDELKGLLDKCTNDDYISISSVSGVGSPREKEDVANENYIQGIEKMIDTMQGTAFSAILIANNLSQEQLLDIRAEYEVLYSKLVPFLKSELSFSESSSDGVTKTLSESLSTTLTKSKSSALSAGTTESTAHTTGGSDAQTDTAGASYGIGSGLVGGPFVSAQYSHSVTRTKSWSDTTTFGTTKTQTSTIGDAEAKGEIKSISDGKSQTETTGRTLQITYLNKTIQNLLDRIDEQLERLKEGENYGIFATAAYFLSADPMATKMAASSYKGLINGNSTHVENAHINSWQDEGSVEVIKNYLRKLKHPIFDFADGNVITPVSIVSGRELAVQFGLPRKSIPGVSVLETAAFGRNVEIDEKRKTRYFGLGTLYHMGKTEEGANGKRIPVKVDMDSLPMHTFITGSTGSGKSNTIYKLLEKIGSNGVKFLVVEPAKGEYKDKIGKIKGVVTYGTNPKILDMKLLRINPFRFPEHTHVLEHLDRLVEIFNVCWPMYAAMPAILKDAVERAYESCGWDLEISENKYSPELFPTFRDVTREIKQVLEESDYSADNKGDYTGALVTRLRTLTNGINGMIFSADDLKDEELFDSNVIVDLSRVGSTETKSLIMGVLVLKLQEHRMEQRAVGLESDEKLKHVTVLEEAHNLLRRTSTEQISESSNLLGKSVEMLANSIAEMRTYGEGFIIADQSPGLLDMSVIRNTNTKIILRLPDFGDRELVGRAAGLNDSQIVELAKLEKGVAAVYQNDWIEPVLCKIDLYTGKNVEFSNDDKKPKGKSVLVDHKKAEQSLLKWIMNKELYREGERVDIEDLISEVVKSGLDGKVKCDFLKYLSSGGEESIESLRSLVYGFLNAEEAIKKTGKLKDINEWVRLVAEKLSPEITDGKYTNEQIDLVMALLVYEQSVRDASFNDIFCRFTEVYQSEGGVY